jgi:hypothetical protein
MPFPKNGPKDWSPNKVQEILEALEEHTIDTSWHQGNLHPRLRGMADVAANGKLSAFHVTDDPEATSKALKRGELLEPGSRYACSGIVVSALPKEYKAASQKKWDFLKSMPRKQAVALEALLVDWLLQFQLTGYITKAEYNEGRDSLERWLDTQDPSAVVMLARQPYNLDIADIAERNKIAKPFRAYVVTVIFEGRYLEQDSQVQYWSIPLAAYHLKKAERDVEMADLCRTWRELGWDGLLVTGRHGADPAHVEIWNPDKILSYGTTQETRRLSGRMSGKQSGRLGAKGLQEGGIIQEGRRFMSSLSPSMKMAMIQEVNDRSRMFGPMRLPAMQDLKETVERLRMGLEPYPGRFKVDLSKEFPEIVDTEVYRRIKALSDEDIAELSYLVDELLTEMEA